MAEASEIDIGGSRWTIKDKESRERIATLEEKASANFEYSAEEKEIGTWIDGKPLYRLIIQGTTTNRTLSLNLSSRNIEKITRMDGVLNASGNYFLPIPSYLARYTSEIASIYAYAIYSIGNKDLNITFGSANYYSSVEVIMQLEYTKNE